MSVVINTNSAATTAAANLASSTQLLQKSLNRLSTGSRIVSPEDDAGGLAVSMKLTSTIHRQQAVASNISNSASFLQTQDGVLNVVGKVLTRMSELKMLYLDPTKNTSDKANYNSEFTQLQSQITSLSNEKFNGISLFGANGLSVGVTAESGGATVNFGAASLLGAATTFTDTFASFSPNWTNTSTGAGTATPGSGVTFSDSTGAASLTSVANFSGPMTIQFDITSGDVQMDLGGTFLNGFIGFGGSTIKLVLNGSGNMQTFVDNSPMGSSNGQPTSGQLKLYAVPVGQGGSGIGHISNFSITSSGGGGGGGNTSTVVNASDLGAVNLSTISSALQDVATFRANNGAQQSRLGFAAEVLTTNKANLSAANSRITDIDVAEESTQLARYNVLVQAGTAMLSQANQSTQAALKLIG